MANGTITLDDVLRLFQQTGERMQQTDEQIRQLRESARKSEKRYRRESEERYRRESEERKREYEERVRQMDERMERASQALNEKFDRTDRQIEATNKQIAGITDSLGWFVERTVAPACETLFHNRGIPVHQVAPRRKVRRHGDTMELDLTVINDGVLMVVEAKFTLKREDLDHFITKLPRVTEFFHEYRGMQVLGAVVGMVVHDDIARLAHKMGLFVLVPSGDTVKIANPDDFKPKAWPQVETSAGGALMPADPGAGAPG
ncbi:MAG: DUF3782 domain-containing protein [Magnetococcales bacterium]|nr:DUF3782 domain-containing protein [Magnetococcales bacterium]